MNATLKDITKAVQGQLIFGDPKAIATQATIDSRHIDPKSIFFAIKGQRVDGHSYALQAAQQGASAVVVSQLDWLQNNTPASGVIRVDDTVAALQRLGFWIRSTFQGPVVGITGSNGKTTTKQMVAGILRQKSAGLFTEGNYNSQIGLPLVLSRLESHHQWIVLEMGASAPGNIAGLADIAHPSIGVITSIGPAHLASFGSIQRIAETKWELIDSLPADGIAVLPWGDPHLEPLIRSYTKKVIFFGDSSSCPVRATAIENMDGMKFMLHLGSDSQPVKLNVPGRHNVNNALAAAAVAWSLGCDLATIAAGLSSFDPPPMRMQVIHHPSGLAMINDAYNANPASMSTAVRSLVESYPHRQRVVVIGSMLELGVESHKYHFQLGTELARFPLDKIVVVGEEAKAVCEGAIAMKAPAGKIVWVASAADVRPHIKSYFNDQSAILFKGSRGVQLEKSVEAALADVATSQKREN
jgi:UDP-N-acetylmuramoyl-tripeptide--D-alanyl-D-alanine ligase